MFKDKIKAPKPQRKTHAVSSIKKFSHPLKYNTVVVLGNGATTVMSMTHPGIGPRMSLLVDPTNHFAWASPREIEIRKELARTEIEKDNLIPARDRKKEDRKNTLFWTQEKGRDS